MDLILNPNRSYIKQVLAEVEDNSYMCVFRDDLHTCPWSYEVLPDKINEDTFSYCVCKMYIKEE